MIVYVFAQDWGGPFAAAPGDKPPIARIYVRKSHSIPQIVGIIQKHITQAKQGKRSIWLMHLCAHGNVGLLGLGSGLRSDNAHFFEDLADWMTPGGPGVYLHGCWTASNALKSHDANRRPFELGQFYPKVPGVARGFQLLHKLSRALQCPVKAGVDVQIGDKYYQLEGPTIEVTPGGYTIDDVTWRKHQSARVQ